VLPICQTWEDYLWAYFFCLIESRIDQKLILKKSHLFAGDYVDLPVPSFDLQESEIFDALTYHDNHKIRDASLNPFRVLQKHLINNTLNEYFQKLSKSLQGDKKHENLSGDNIVRFATQLILHLRHNGMPSSEETDFIIQRYVEILQINNMVLFFNTGRGNSGISQIITRIESNTWLFHVLTRNNR
jgi:nuclear pore complex protein Nup107